MKCAGRLGMLFLQENSLLRPLAPLFVNVPFHHLVGNRGDGNLRLHRANRAETRK